MGILLQFFINIRWLGQTKKMMNGQLRRFYSVKII